MRFIPLASSSAGNAYLVQDGASLLLIECGVSFRRLGQLVRGAGFQLSALCGCLISHEHKDHARCWDKLADSGVPVYASDGTIAALEAEEKVLPLAPDAGEDISAPVRIGTFDVLAFRTFHDAREPIGFLIRSTADGEKLAFAADTVNLRYQFPSINLLAIEANFSEEILLRNTSIPDDVIKRIKNTHMEVRRLCSYLEGLDLMRCREVWLMHLSDAGSNEVEFGYLARQAVPPHVHVIVCQKGG